MISIRRHAQGVCLDGRLQHRSRATGGCGGTGRARGAHMLPAGELA